MLCAILLKFLLSQCGLEGYVVKPVIVEHYVIRPTLEVMQQYDARMNSDAAVKQLLGICATESDMGKFLEQIGGGPAKGLCQVEPATEQWIRKEYLERHPVLQGMVMDEIAFYRNNRDDEFFENELMLNPRYNVAIARLVLWTKPEPLPDANDLIGQASYWKRHYNTVEGKGTEGKYIASWNEHMSGR